MLSNLAADEKFEAELDFNKLDILLQFTNPEIFQRYKAIREGRQVAPGPDVHGEVSQAPASPEFLDGIATLPERRIGKPAAKDEYVAKRMAEIAEKRPDLLEPVKIEVATQPVGEKQFVYERKVVYKRKDNG